MAITVLFFGQLAEITGAGELKIDDPGETNENSDMAESAGTNLAEISGTKLVTSTKELMDLLLSRFPALGEFVFNIAVDAVIIEKDVRLKPGSTVALLPPFSGG
jgi:molybdopterin converting factor small subunit